MCIASEEPQNVRLINNSSVRCTTKEDCWPKPKANASVLICRCVEVTETMRDWRIYMRKRRRGMEATQNLKSAQCSVIIRSVSPFVN